MSSATKPSGSLSSVWDTLNAIKARQKAAEAATPPGKTATTRRSGGEPAAARKRLLELFEKRVADAAAARNAALDAGDTGARAGKPKPSGTDDGAPPRTAAGSTTTPAGAPPDGDGGDDEGGGGGGAAAQTAAQLLAAFDADCRNDEQVARLRDMYVTRAKNDAQAQLAAVRRLLKEGEDSVVVAKHALRGAQRVAKGLVGVASAC